MATTTQDDAPMARSIPDEFVEVTFPGVDRPGLLHLPTMRVIPPLCGADPEPEPDPDPDVDPTSDPDPDADPDPAPPKEPDWKAMSRKHEREAKAARKREAELEAKLKEREDADKSEHEKAVEAARAEGESAALSKYEQQRRADRLETAVIRLAAKGVKVGDGDDAKVAKFADPDDVLMFIERRIAKGEVDPEDIYDKDGKVVASALADVLAELAADKPGWLEQPAGGNGGGGGGRPAGDADAGKGKGGGSAIESMSVEEHVKRMARG